MRDFIRANAFFTVVALCLALSFGISVAHKYSYNNSRNHCIAKANHVYIEGVCYNFKNVK